MVNLDAADPLSAELRAAVGAELAGFLDSHGEALAELGPEVSELVSLAHAFTTGGKRLRPAFCCWGYLAAAGGTIVPPHVLRAASSLDLLHVSALIHDDVMDGSDTRRGILRRTSSWLGCTQPATIAAIPRPSDGPERSCWATCC